MARKKIGLDYFPVDVSWDQSVKVFKAKFGLVGVGFLLTLFQTVYAEGYYLKWGEDERLLFAAENGLTEPETDDMVSFTIKKEIFNEDIYTSFGVLTSAGIQRRYLEACRKRTEVVFQAEYLLFKPSITSSSRLEIKIENFKESICSLPGTKSDDRGTKSGEMGGSLPQRKGEERRGEESKGKQQLKEPEPTEKPQRPPGQIRPGGSIALFVKTFSRQPNGFELPMLSDLEQGHPEKVLAHAFKEAGESGAKTLKYVAKILEDCDGDGNRSAGVKRSVTGKTATHSNERQGQETSTDWAGDMSAVGVG